MSFRRGTRKDGSRYTYPINSRESSYEGRPLQVERRPSRLEEEEPVFEIPEDVTGVIPIVEPRGTRSDLVPIHPIPPVRRPDNTLWWKDPDWKPRLTWHTDKELVDKFVRQLQSVGWETRIQQLQAKYPGSKPQYRIWIKATDDVTLYPKGLSGMATRLKRKESIYEIPEDVTKVIPIREPRTVVISPLPTEPGMVVIPSLATSHRLKKRPPFPGYRKPIPVVHLKSRKKKKSSKGELKEGSSTRLKRKEVR